MSNSKLNNNKLLKLVKIIPSHTIPISKIVYDENNPNKMSATKIQALDDVITKYGFAVEPWVNKQNDGTYLVIDGQHRVKMLCKKGVKKIKVKVFEVSYGDVRMLRQVANKLRGEHDSVKDATEIKAIFEDENLDEFAKLLAEPVDNFEKILEKHFDISFKVEEDYAPKLSTNPKSKLGDMYLLGGRGKDNQIQPHKIMCGDTITQLPLLLDGKKPTMLFTDPPYGLGGYAGRSGKFGGVRGDDEDPRKFYECLPQDIAHRYIWGNWFNVKTIKEIPRDVIVWKKNNFGMGKGYRGQYEICMYFGNFAGSDTDVWEVKKDTVTEYMHPTQKPVDLARRAIINSSKKGDIVLDAYLGSGSTLIACEQTNRVCFGMELDCSYVDVILDRWSNFTNKDPIRIRDNKKWSEIKNSN